MKYFELKLAILSLFLYLIPCVCGLLFINTSSEDKISVYDIKSSKILSLTVDEYITGVVAAEMPAEFDIEALKAQSVAARTYLVKKEICDKYAKCDICTDSSHCQAYKSTDEMKKQWGNKFKKYYSKISDAVRSTSGQIITYNNEPISAVFHSTSSGRTENSEDVWVSAMPYLRSTESIEDVNSPKYLSQKTIPRTEFVNTILSDNEYVNFDNGIIGSDTRTKGGSVDTVTIGDKAFEGTKIRQLFGLNSANFDITEDGDNIIFTVYGYGHGVGMSQYGADFMAKNGYNYKDILHKYYSDVDIVCFDEYNSD